MRVTIGLDTFEEIIKLIKDIGPLQKYLYQTPDIPKDLNIQIEIAQDFTKYLIYLCQKKHGKTILREGQRKFISYFWEAYFEEVIGNAFRDDETEIEYIDGLIKLCSQEKFYEGTINDNLFPLAFGALVQLDEMDLKVNATNVTLTGLLITNYIKLGQTFLFLQGTEDETTTQRMILFMQHYAELVPPAMLQSILEPIESINQETSEPTQQSEENYEKILLELKELIGLDRVKQEVETLTNSVKINQIRKQQGLKLSPVSMHLVFSGNPGTGKTTVARILAKIYKNIGVLSSGQLIEVDRSGLVGGFLGQTAIKTKEVVEKAKGGILFIDEAYSLSSGDDNYGREAIETLLKAMEDYREDFVVIVAGYTDLMNDFLSSNPGLKSRFGSFINFDDYSPDELYSVFLGMCNKYQYILAKDVVSYLKNRLEDEYSKRDKSYANARTVRNIFENSIKRQANRLSGIVNSSIKDDDLKILKKNDIVGEE